MLTINTNINNLKLQRNLGAVNFAMQTALNRISTGYRINSASDDAAGLVISTALGVQTRGLNIANQNAQIGMNVLSAADGALGQMGNLTMRIRDLATQAANGGYSPTERRALELEAKELTLSLEQLVNGTKFNEFDIFKSTAAAGITTEADATAQGYTIIRTAAELQAIATGNLSGKYMLMNNIDLSSIANFSSIGTTENAFTGTFDGNGFTISNLTMSTSVHRQGFFGRTDGGTVKNVTLENVNITSTGGAVGGLVGASDYGSTITNCSVSGTVKGAQYAVGGLIGYGSVGTVTNCYSTVNVTGINGIGGLIGVVDNNTIANSYATGNVTSVGAGTAGGFLGEGYQNTITNCYAAGNITGAGTIGGFVGYTEGIIINNSYYAGQNNAASGNRGGFIGGNSGVTCTSSYFVTQTAGFSAVGSGGVPTGLTRQDSPFFTPEFAQSTLSDGTGTGQWDFSGPTPKLKHQIKPPEKNNILTFQIGTTGNKNSTVSIDTSFSLNGFSANFADTDAARATMVKCDALLLQINTKRSEIGANANIFEAITEGNTVTNENLSASKSRIQDADIARESANMVKNRILENATAALLAQTKNVNGDLALALLNGIRR